MGRAAHRRNGSDCRARALVALAALVSSTALHADPVDVVNALRSEGCRGVPAVGSAARRDSALDAAARALADDAELEEALARVGYPAATSTSLRVRGARGDAAIRGALAGRYCESINRAALTEIGAHQRGDSTWIVMAGRSAQPFAALRDPAAVAQRVLELVNAARAAPRRCGRTTHAAAPVLQLSTVLTAAASLHSLDMAERGRLAHEGSDGSSSAERITRAGYAWRGSGENIAAGQGDAETVVAAWLLSPGHCATLMEPNFTETGIAFALAPGKDPAVYWTQVFAAPR